MPEKNNNDAAEGVLFTTFGLIDFFAPGWWDEIVDRFLLRDVVKCILFCSRKPC